MKLYANKSLNLRRGKWTSQLAHSLMKHFLLNATWCDDSKSYLIPISKFDKFYDIVTKAITNEEKLNINWLTNGEELEQLESSLSPYTASIIDHARTELTEPTKTCFAYDDTERLVPVDNLAFEEQVIHTKQVIALNRKVPKDVQYSLGASLSLKSLMDQFVLDGSSYRLSFEDNENFALWLKGAFAKITVKFNDTDEEINSVNEKIDEAKDLGIHTDAVYFNGKLACVIFGAAKSANLDNITGSFKLY